MAPGTPRPARDRRRRSGCSQDHGHQALPRRGRTHTIRRSSPRRSSSREGGQDSSSRFRLNPRALSIDRFRAGSGRRNDKSKREPEPRQRTPHETQPHWTLTRHPAELSLTAADVEVPARPQRRSTSVVPTRRPTVPRHAQPATSVPSGPGTAGCPANENTVTATSSIYLKPAADPPDVLGRRRGGPGGGTLTTSLAAELVALDGARRRRTAARYRERGRDRAF